MWRCVSVFGRAWMNAARDSGSFSFMRGDRSGLAGKPASAGQQVFRVQLLEGLRHEDPVPSDELSVEPDLPAAVLGPLDADHVPVNLGLVAVAAVSIGLTRCEVEGAR